LTSQSRSDEAATEIRRAVQFDPLSVPTSSFGTLFMLFAAATTKRFSWRAEQWSVEPNAPFALAFQGVAYAQQGRFSEAVANLRKAAQRDGSPTIHALQAHVLAVAGQKAEALRLVRQVQDHARTRYVCPYEIGTVYASLGDNDTAHEWFRKGVNGRADCMAWLGVEPWLDPFRADARYVKLLQDIGLDPHAR
jgi:tetratricopeptide (TPR) repeat protein